MASIGDLEQSGFTTVRLKVQLQKKLAFPLITLVMAVLAVPFAASGRKGGALGSVVIAVAIAVVYWVTAGLFEAMGNANQLPAMLVWPGHPTLFLLLPEVTFCCGYRPSGCV